MSESGNSVLGSEGYKLLVRKRAVVKAKITNLFKKCDLGSQELSEDEFLSLSELITSYLNTIKGYDEEINVLFCSVVFTELDESCVQELNNQSDHSFEITRRLEALKIGQTRTKSKLHAQLEHDSNLKLKLPELKCEYFSGEESDSLKYHGFITQFQNVVGMRGNLSKATKLTYLKSFLKSYAFKLIQHLIVSESNYDLALDLLNKEFLDENAIIEELLKKTF